MKILKYLGTLLVLSLFAVSLHAAEIGSGNTFGGAATGGALTDPLSSTSTVDFGAAESLEIPNGATLTLDAPGEIGLDTTEEQMRMRGNSTEWVYATPYKTTCVTVEELAAADDDMLFYSPDVDITVKAAWCFCNSIKGTCTTEADIQLQHVDTTDASVTTMTSGTIDCEDLAGSEAQTSITANNDVSAIDTIIFDVTNTPDPATDQYQICIAWIYKIK